MSELLRHPSAFEKVKLVPVVKQSVLRWGRFVQSRQVPVIRNELGLAGSTEEGWQTGSVSLACKIPPEVKKHWWRQCNPWQEAATLCDKGGSHFQVMKTCC
ncbi:small membrane A-kinase anchor protein isoform X2 [Numida meleagris]|uniref:small membrane A-kinase anchor protein isoform X2 n=1 Tax=Numida meleagris TaxID=8996 RepID=UPI000B3DFC71|nr:small membrane A-kinase anchor protein isoform X2 [Numida meleagris]